LEIVQRSVTNKQKPINLDSWERKVNKALGRQHPRRSSPGHQRRSSSPKKLDECK